jgi:hypothetical protein
MALWAVIILVGFVFTYYYQALDPLSINIVWAILAIIGLTYSKRQMPFSDVVLKNIFMTWLVVIVLGIIFSHLSFVWSPLVYYASLLGAVWLVFMALGHAITGWIDGKKVYIITTALQLIAAIYIFVSVGSMPDLYSTQYLIAGIVGAISMVLLILLA